MQMRFGPSYTGVCGCLQPIADALKLFCKRGALKNISQKAILSICFLMAISLIAITLIPLSAKSYLFNSDFSLIYIILIQMIISFLEITIGIESGAKYGLIGGIREYFQNLASNLSYFLSILCIASIADSFNIIEIVELQNNLPFIIILCPIFIIFFIISLINLNRLPFDFTEAESEIIAGNYVEYGGMLFAMIYLSEYLCLIFSSSIIVLLFLGGWHSFFGISFIPPEILMIIKVIFIVFLIIVIRAIFPRYKQKYIIHLSWSLFPLIILIYFVLFEYILY